jgi:hypothetical protein
MRRRRSAVVVLLALAYAAGPTWTPPTKTYCLTYEEKSLDRWQSVCDDGTRATHRWNRVLGRWESTVTTPPAGGIRQGLKAPGQ